MKRYLEWGVHIAQYQLIMSFVEEMIPSECALLYAEKHLETEYFPLD